MSLIHHHITPVSRAINVQCETPWPGGDPWAFPLSLGEHKPSRGCVPWILPSNGCSLQTPRRPEEDDQLHQNLQNGDIFFYLVCFSVIFFLFQPTPHTPFSYLPLNFTITVK